MKNIIVGQSGGPTAVINSSIAGVYKKAKELGYEHVYGMVNGIEGFLNENIIDLDEYLSDNENYELLKRTPSAFLGSCRYKLPKFEDDPNTYKKIFDILEKYEIESLLYTGGNDSMDTVKMLSDYAKENNRKETFFGVPKTIDNDLPITDHCPGYGSCAKYIATSLKEIIRDNESFNKSRLTVCIVEIMGRHAGWLTAASAIANDGNSSGVDAIYLPEVTFDLNEFLKLINDLKDKKNSIVIAVSEGIQTKDGKFVCELDSDSRSVDAFGHKQLSGCASTLCNIVAKETGLKTRAIEFSTLQRAASHIASLRDIEEAEQAGMRAVEEVNNGNTGMMVTLKRIANNPYKCVTDIYDIHDIANVEKKIPLEWIDEKNHQMKKEFLEYAKPLIIGELTPIFKDGLPQHLVRK